MMLPAGPMASLIIGQTRFALATLETCFDAVFSLGHSGQRIQRGLRDRIGQIIVHFHDLILVAVTVAYHRHPFLVALLPPMGSGDHTPFDHLDHQWPFRTIADIEAPPDRVSSCSRGPPAESARPSEPVDDETNRDAPSHRPLPSNDAAVRRHAAPASPTLTGDGCGSRDGRWSHRLCPSAPYPGSMLWAGITAGRPAYDPCATRSPRRWPLDNCPLCPDGRTTAGLPRPTPARTWERPRDRTPARHRLVPIAGPLGSATCVVRGHHPSHPSR